MDKPSQRWWDVPAAFFLLVVIMTVATRLYATTWTGHLERVQYIALLGTVAGLALGQSRFSPRAVKWLAVAYGLFAVPWQLGATMEGSIAWHERIASLGGRLGASLWTFLHSEPVQDPILFLALMGVLFWVLGTSAGYYLTRYGHPWAPILPAGIGLYIINHYDPALPIWARYIGIYLFAALLYLGRVTYLRYREEWRQKGVFTAPETGFTIGRAGLLAVLVLVVFAWNFPVFAAAFSPASQLWVKVSHPWETLRERFSDAFTSLRSSVGVVSDFYGATMPLGTGTPLGDGIIFTVKPSDQPPEGTHFYWQARTYDTYSDGEWTSSLKDEQTVGPGATDMIYPQWADRQSIQFIFGSNVALLNTLYSAPNPLWVSRPGKAVVGSNGDGSVDVNRLVADPPLRAGETYYERAWIAAPTVTDLRASGQDYPQWVTERYLELPEGLPERVKQLAQQLTAGLTDPYDKAEAITSFLRTSIQYRATIPAPPADRDPVDWFLFDERQGFCNYYASAEVILLRSLGIPARMAVGFAQGTYDAATGVYTVRNRDGHAWPEVYFNGLGWIEFEPTAAQPAITLPAGTTATDTSSADEALSRLERLNEGDFASRAKDTPGELTLLPAEQPRQLSRWLLLIPAALLLMALAGGWALARRRALVPPLAVVVETTLTRRGVTIPGWVRRWARRAQLTPLEKAFASINQALWLQGAPADPSLTPAERVELLASLMPEAGPQAERLLGEYQRTLYSPQPGDLPSAVRAASEVRRRALATFLRRLVTRQPAVRDVGRA